MSPRRSRKWSTGASGCPISDSIGRARRLSARPIEMLEDAFSDCRIGRAKRDGPSGRAATPIQPQPASGHQRVDRGGRERGGTLSRLRATEATSPARAAVGVKRVDDGEDRTLVRVPRLARHHHIATTNASVTELGY